MTVAMKKHIRNDSMLLKKISSELIQELRRKDINEEAIFEVHVSFEEALRNAMMHGNRQDPGKKVLVETEIKDGILYIAVEDEGEGFEPAHIPDPTLEENLLKESGRGVYLINRLMDEVKYEKGGRRVIMIKYLNKEKAGSEAENEDMSGR
jgi:serine/threonine-protein kinase RsbW